jgi:hypothetical protein
VSPATPRAGRASAAAKPRAQRIPKERVHFKELLLANHFGTIPGSKLKAKAAAKGNTTYEQLMCVGYNPAARRLDAVVHIKQNGGYNGGLCTNGSHEYVKFFASSDGGTTWTELGTTSFQVWDEPGPKPLEYDATLYVDLDEQCCQDENIVLVRAILSWEVPPGGPDDPVVWGNALDASIQVEPLSGGKLIDVFECLHIPFVEAELAKVVDPGQPVEFGVKKQLTPLELQEAYKGTKVPEHRYLFSHVQELLAAPAILPQKLAEPGFELFPGLENIDVSKLIGLIIDPQGNLTFEQIGCVGLNEGSAELVATVDVKLSNGYSGNLCTDGSNEYVAFWVDWGGGFEYVGTTSVNVHDISSIPPDHLHYSAALPFPQLYTHRQPCGDGPRTALVRAVLSWATPPSTTDPYAVPFWGGHAETRILLPPGETVGTGGPMLESIGRMANTITSIDSSGLGQGVSALGGFTVHNSPFGGQVTFSGHVVNRAVTQFGGPGIFYRIWISTDGGYSWAFMNTTFTVFVQPLFGLIYPVSQSPVSLPAPFGDGWYPYLADGISTTVVENALGYWQSAGDGQALIYMEAKDPIGYLGSPTALKMIQLDNTRPDDAIAITSGGGSCGDFKVGEKIQGTYWASDNERLCGIGMSVEPVFVPGSLTRTPSISTPTFESGTWQLDTGMTSGPLKYDPCGYVVRFDAADCTNVDSRGNPWDMPAFVGFCLKK